MDCPNIRTTDSSLCLVKIRLEIWITSDSARSATWPCFEVFLNKCSPLASRVLPLSSSDQSENKVSQLIKLHQTQSLFIILSKQLSVIPERFILFLFKPLQKRPRWLGGKIIDAHFAFKFSTHPVALQWQSPETAHEGEILASLPLRLYISEIWSDADTLTLLLYGQKGDRCCSRGRWPQLPTLT